MDSHPTPRELYFKARELPADERAAYLEHATADPAIRALVLELLRHDQVGPPRWRPGPLPSLDLLTPGLEFGQYRLVRRRAGLLGGLVNLAAGGDLPAVLDVLTDGTGDGAVAVSSTMLDGAAEHVVLHVNHVELIRGPLFFPDPGPVACAPIVLRWLAASLPVAGVPASR